MRPSARSARTYTGKSTPSGRIRGAENGPAPPVPYPDKQQISRADAHVLRCLGREQISGGHMVTRLEPVTAAGPGNVEHDPAAGDSLARGIDGERADAIRAPVADENIIVKTAVVDDMAERVDVTIGVAVHVQGQAVE